MRAHAALPGDAQLIVCDCVDVEPGLEVNRHLLRTEAEAVLEGAYIAAFATKTPRLAIHVAESDREGADSVTRALETLRADTPGRATGGAATGGSALAPLAAEAVIVRAPFRRNMKGYEDVPTLVLTAETLFHIGRILAKGADWYRASGTESSPGTKLFQLSGAVNKPGIYRASSWDDPASAHPRPRVGASGR